MTNLKLGTFCSVVPSKQGEFLGIWNNYAGCPNQRISIHYKLQLWKHGVLINTMPLCMEVKQRMYLSRHKSRLSMDYHTLRCQCLPNIRLLPCIIMTGADDYHPMKYDDSLSFREHLHRLPKVPIDTIYQSFNNNRD